ncbi:MULTISPECIES: hypothetical protein [unclassified Streptomyces]|uniref:hypothetical protein n=1 Tax=unclassified Streptomyces TaxID=2593676 RepID=UPI002E25F74A
MLVKRAMLTGAAAAVAVIFPLTASPACAAGSQDTLHVDTAWGEATGYYTWTSPWSISPLKLHLQDQKSDGHSVGVRVITNSHNRGVTYWTMHKVTGGYLSSDGWDTYVKFEDHDNMSSARMQMCLLEKDEILSCGEDVSNNPGNWDNS